MSALAFFCSGACLGLAIADARDRRWKSVGFALAVAAYEAAIGFSLA